MRLPFVFGSHRPTGKALAFKYLVRFSTDLVLIGIQDNKLLTLLFHRSFQENDYMRGIFFYIEKLTTSRKQ